MEKTDPLYRALKEVGVNGDNYQVLALLPLVFVSWADGKVQKAEREKIMEVAREQHFLREGGERLLLHWLDEEPTPEYYEKGFKLLIELARRHRGVGEDITTETLEELIDLSFDVAKAAGGLWGQFWSVCPEEEVAIAKIAKALSVDDGLAWKELIEDLDGADKAG